MYCNPIDERGERRAYLILDIGAGMCTVDITTQVSVQSKKVLTCDGSDTATASDSITVSDNVTVSVYALNGSDKASVLITTK